MILKTKSLVVLVLQVLMYSCISKNILNPSLKPYSWNKYVEQKGIPIKLNNNDSDILFLDKYIRDKTIVMLGEQPHNSIGINLIKGNFVKFLHRSFQFNVIAFEMSMDYCGIKNFSKDSIDLNEYSKGLGMWNTKENLGLAKYIKENMDLAGIDLTPASRFKTVKYLTQLICAVDSNMAKYNECIDDKSNRLYEDFLRNTTLTTGNKTLAYHKFKNQDSLKIFRGKAKSLISSMDSISNFFYKNSRKFNLSENERLFIEKLIANKKIFIDYLLKDYNWAYRDSVMGQNLNWLAENLYPNKKFIVWAANAHIKKNGILSDELSKTVRSKCYHIAFCPSLGTSKGLFDSDAVFVDLSEAAQLTFKPGYFNNYKNDFDAIILIKNIN